jgi:sterol desaturase/sphingolipid hydroxylase (fatty acid hydroxylase superfamily)
MQNILSLFIFILLVIINIFYVTLYKNEFPFFEKFKCNNLPWPWKENLKKFKNELPGQVLLYLLNLLIIPPIFNYIFDSFLKFRIDNIYPQFSETIISIILFGIFEDFFFYWGHRLLHLPLLYPIHKLHHYNYNVIHISSVYVHPLESFIGNIFPSFSGIMVFGPYFHITSVCVFLAYRIMKTHEQHGGYDFFPSIFHFSPFSSCSNFHNFHHLKNIGNYGSFFTYWDDMFGTSKIYNSKYK